MRAEADQLAPDIASPVYENLLAQDSRWALMEGSRHFDEQSSVFAALKKIANRLDGIGVPYAVVGGMALFQHGYRRFTEDVDILVTPADLKTIHEQLDGLGYLPPHRNSRHLRDTELGVRIEFLTSGSFPGDGKPKPVAFPDPSQEGIEIDGVRYVKLPRLIELKLASGMTNPGRLRDLSDVMELIRVWRLSQEYARRLDSYVREKFTELWRQTRTRYVTVWKDAAITDSTSGFDELINAIGADADRLREMRDAGVLVEETGEGFARLVTDDLDVATQFGMVEESEYWDVD